MSWEQWRALPWYEQRALREALARDPRFHELIGSLAPLPPSTPEAEAEALAAFGVSIT